MEKRKVAMISLGCAKNRVNSEQMMYLLREAGYEVTGEPEGAAAVVVNTCAFIESAKTEAIETILEIAALKERNKTGKLIVAGCLPERYKTEVLREMPEIDGIVGTGSFDDIVAAVGGAIEGKPTPLLFGDINAPVSEAGRVATTPPAWTYLKIAEGCDNRCAYCVIPSIRGRYRSREMESIIAEAREHAGRGARELIVVAQDVTGYGRDIRGGPGLKELLERLCEIPTLKWIRLHYLYPDRIDEDLIDVIAKNDKIAKYLDIPIQHISDGILTSMRRRGSGREIRELFKNLRARIPGLVLRTSLITGLPGEGEREFEELCEFLGEEKIERAGIFAYSPEEGTDAALMKRPDRETAALRAERLTGIQADVMEGFNKSRVGSRVGVIVETRERGRYLGRSYAESPEIDGHIIIKGRGVAIGEFIDARITGIEDGMPVGSPAIVLRAKERGN